MTLVKKDTNMHCNLVVDEEEKRHDGFAFKSSIMKKTKNSKNEQIKIITVTA